MIRRRPEKNGYLTERLETNVDEDLAMWVHTKAEGEGRTPAAVVRRALQAYRVIEDSHTEGVKILGTARKPGGAA